MKREDSLRLAVFCFCAGNIAGTVWANGTGTTLREQIGVYGQAYLMGGYGSVPGAGRLAGLFLQRGSAAFVVWLVGMTVFARPALCAAAAGIGFSMAFLIACMTVQWGVGGFPVFIASLLPQYLFYVPAGAVLVSWAASDREKTHLPGFLILLLAVLAGSAAELWVNPLIMRGIISIIEI